MKTAPAEKQRGFTLLELSIVLIIVALVTGMAATSGISIIATARLTGTQNKMKAIDDALMQYRNANDRLPCPGDLTIAPGATNYGVEGTIPGTCIGGSPAANFSAAGATNTTATAAEGALPAVTLGLSNDFMLDGWGNRFRYAVDVSMTALGAFSGTPLGCTIGAITVKDANGTARSKGSIYALISHGANGHGAYTRNGVTLNAASVNTNEQTNCHCNSSAAATTYAPTYVQMASSVDAGNALDNFDDLVSYKERWQMRTDWDTSGSCPYLAVATSASPYVTLYRLHNGALSKLPAPTGTLPDNQGNGLDFSPDNSLLAWAGAQTSSQNIGMLYQANTSGLSYASTYWGGATHSYVQNAGNKFSGDGTYLAVANGCCSYFSVYKKSGSTYSNAGITITPVPANPPWRAKWSPDNSLVYVAEQSRYLDIYSRSGDTFTLSTTLDLTSYDLSATLRLYDASVHPGGDSIAITAKTASGYPPIVIKNPSGTPSLISNSTSGLAAVNQNNYTSTGVAS